MISNQMFSHPYLTSLLIAVFVQTVNCQATGQVAGIGIGTFIIILAILFSIVWCLACRTSTRPELYSALGILIPAILILIFVFMPKEKDRIVTTQTTDMNFVTHVVFMVIALLAFVLAGTFLCIGYAFTEKKAKNIARSAFVMKEEEQEGLTRRSKMGNSRLGSEGPVRPLSRQSGD